VRERSVCRLLTRAALIRSFSRRGRGNPFLQCLNNLQPCPHGALRIIFMGCWIAEVDQQAIAQVLGNMPVVPPDHARAGFLIGTHHLPQFFGIELRGERG
jgi:hypothetical protein